MNPKSIFTSTDISRLKPLVSTETLAALEAIENDVYIPSVFTDTVGEKIDNDTLRKICLNQWEDGAGEKHVFQLGERVFVTIDVDCEEGIFEFENIEEFISQWNPRGCAIEDLLVNFGVAPTLDVAEKGYMGTCRVWIRQHYAANNVQAPYDTWAKDEDYKIIEFDSYAAASKWVKKAKYDDHDWRTDHEPKGHYRYSNSELEPKEYIICKGWREPI